jgi:O-antigen/teichoic acid export membrane protein
LGDLGITGALGLQVGTMLGRRDEAGLKSLLASARSLFLFLAAGLSILFIGSSPWLAKWLNFESVAGVGSMTLLFVYGGLSLGLMIIGGYFASVNYAHGTVTWTIIPAALFVQIAAPFFHWRLALLHMPLWIQLLPYLAAAVLVTVLSWRMLKWSHPWLGDLVPLKRDRAEWKTLATTSWWAYLIGVGTAIYVSTDLLVINSVIGPDLIPMYKFNYRICELAIALLVSAAFVGLPKLTQWISSPNPADRQRLLVELDRLSMFEVVFACGAVLSYIAFNNLFIRLWLDKAHQAPLALQAAFACNLAVSVGGNAGIQLSMRSGDNGLRYAGLAVAGTGLLNLALSILSVKIVPDKTSAIIGVAVATVIAQSISSLCLGTVTCRYLGMSAFRWAARCWFLPMGFTLMAVVLKELFPRDSFLHLSILAGCYLVVFLAVCWLAGINRELLRTEFAHARKLMGLS